ncbi:MAG: hypothetical protein V1859_07245 [archaeon]
MKMKLIVLCLFLVLVLIGCNTIESNKKVEKTDELAIQDATIMKDCQNITNNLLKQKCIGKIGLIKANGFDESNGEIIVFSSGISNIVKEDQPFVFDGYLFQAKTINRDNIIIAMSCGESCGFSSTVREGQEQKHEAYDFYYIINTINYFNGEVNLTFFALEPVKWQKIKAYFKDKINLEQGGYYVIYNGGSDTVHLYGNSTDSSELSWSSARVGQEIRDTKMKVIVKIEKINYQENSIELSIRGIE